MAVPLSCFLLASCAASAQPTESSAFDPARRGTVLRDLVYARPGGVPLAMDLHFPKSRGPWPWVVAVHGGGWSEGDKAGFDLGLARRGFLVATINYRMAPAHRFPAMIEDVKSAIRYLRAHSGELDLDPERAGLVGHSAGGHLVALAALAGPEAGWDVGDNLEQSSAVKAVIELSGPTDLRLSFGDEWANGLRYSVFGEEQWEKASPATWARPDAPAFLIIHGEGDKVVEVEQARLLETALAAAGASAELLVVRRAGHGFEPAGGSPWPPLPYLYLKAGAFLKRHLR